MWKKATQKRIPPPPDDDSEGSDIEVSQSNPAKKKKQYSKPKHPTPAVSDENESDDASSSHSTSNIIPSLKPKYKTFFIVSCQLLYSRCDSLPNLIKCILVHSEVILKAGNIFFLQVV